MKIGIVGNYGNNNQGDEAILDGILTQLEEAYPIQRKEMIVFSNNPPQTREKYGVQSESLFIHRKSNYMKVVATLDHHKPIIRGLDLLIIGGGGILMDLYRNGAIVFSIYAWLARQTKTPAVIYGAGAGPISTPLGKQLIKFIGNTASLVTVRDPQSKQLLQSIGVNQPIHVITDPAFFVSPPENTVRKQAGFHIGVTAVAYYDRAYWPTEDEAKYTNYVEGMAKNLDRLIEENPNVQINFFSTKHPMDTAVTKGIQASMVHRANSTVYEEEMNHREILDFINQQDMVIGTRLHSLILALVAEKPIIAVSYHHKVQDFMDSVDCSDYVFPIEAMHQESHFFSRRFQAMHNDWERTEAAFTALSKEIKNKEPNGMDLVKTMLDRD